MTDKDYAKAIEESQVAAQKAGDEWMKNAKPKYVVRGYEDSPMLDMCGNAHVRVDDGRTKFFKFLKKTYNTPYTQTVPIHGIYRGRQEHGLKVAMAGAALEVLAGKYKIPKLYMWEYID